MTKNINYKSLKKKMNKNVIIILIGLILISGIVVADLTNLLSKNEIIKSNLNSVELNFAIKNIRNVYWDENIKRIGNATFGIVNYEVLKDGEWNTRQRSFFLYNIKEISTTEEELLKQRLSERASSIVVDEYKRANKITSKINIGNKTIEFE